MDTRSSTFKILHSQRKVTPCQTCNDSGWQKKSPDLKTSTEPVPKSKLSKKGQSTWSSSQCVECHRTIGLNRTAGRKHHCRMCLFHVCDDCSTSKFPCPGTRSYGPCKEGRLQQQCQSNRCYSGLLIDDKKCGKCNGTGITGEETKECKECNCKDRRPRDKGWKNGKILTINSQRACKRCYTVAQNTPEKWDEYMRASNSTFRPEYTMKPKFPQTSVLPTPTVFVCKNPSCIKPTVATPQEYQFTFNKICPECGTTLLERKRRRRLVRSPRSPALKRFSAASRRRAGAI